jgi:hypothetical protein
LLLSQLQHEGYSIFIVDGVLPQCEGDLVLANTRVTQTKKPPSKTDRKSKPEAVRLVEEATVGSDGFTDEERKQFRSSIETSQKTVEEEERRQLEVALSLSLSQEASSLNNSLDGPSGYNPDRIQTAISSREDFMTEEEILQLEEALKMSLES